jgi:hypothetical protein
MATNIERDEWKTYYRSVVVTNPATPASGDPVRWGYLTGIALIDESTDITNETSVNFGPFEARLLVDDNVGTGIAVNDLLYYNDTATGSPATNINNTSTGYFFGFAAEAVSANATTTIRVIHVPSPGSGTLAAGGVGTAQLASAAVTPVKLGNGYRALANDAALVLAATDTTILVNTTTGTKAATMTATHAGHMIFIRAVVGSGGSYTLAVTGGDVTLNAANEAAILVYSGAAWELVALMGATLV